MRGLRQDLPTTSVLPLTSSTRTASPTERFAEGQHLIQVGRGDEVGAVLQDLERVEDGGSFVRFLIGPYGSGKTFFAELTRSIALERGFVTVHADLTPDRRLHSTIGRVRLSASKYRPCPT